VPSRNVVGSSSTMRPFSTRALSGLMPLIYDLGPPLAIKFSNSGATDAGQANCASSCAEIILKTRNPLTYVLFSDSIRYVHRRTRPSGSFP
jgi:hypothetical protein